MRALVDEDGRVVCARCELASTLRARTRGLLGRRGLDPGHGLLITRTSSIHTFFMRFPIDAVFLSRRMTVRSIARGVKPFRVVIRLRPGSVLELAAGESERVGIAVGSALAWQDDVLTNAPEGADADRSG